MLTVAQIRATRAMLGWTVGTLALRAGIGQHSIRQLERRREWLRGRPEEMVAQIRQACEAADVTFLNDDGKAGPGLRCCAAADLMDQPRLGGQADRTAS